MTDSTLQGLLVLDKPAGLTSHNAIRKAARLAGARKVGHTGTLDPFATGVLPVLLGKATRVAQFLVHDTKEYRAVIRLGRTTDTLDPTGETTGEAPVPSFTNDDVRSVLNRFTGEIRQIPPMFSAKKVNGSPLYKAARKGRTVEREPKTVVVHRIELTAVEGDRIGIEVTCGPGTYIRVLASEIAEALGTVGHLEMLVRTACGRLRIERAIPLPQVEELAGNGLLDRHILSIDEALSGLRKVVLTEEAARRVGFGGLAGIDDAVDPHVVDNIAENEPLRLAAPDGRLLAVANFVPNPPSGGRFRLIRVLV